METLREGLVQGQGRCPIRAMVGLPHPKDVTLPSVKGRGIWGLALSYSPFGQCDVCTTGGRCWSQGPGRT